MVVLASLLKIYNQFVVTPKCQIFSKKAKWGNDDVSHTRNLALLELYKSSPGVREVIVNSKRIDINLL